MSYILKHVIIFILLSIPFTAVNFSAYLYGDIPQLYQAIASILFLVLWVIYSVYKGKKKEHTFWIPVTIYWGTGALIYTIAMLFDALRFLGIVAALLFPGPMYGWRYFLSVPSDSLLVYLLIIAIYVTSLLGFVIGKFVLSSKRNEKV